MDSIELTARERQTEGKEEFLLDQRPYRGAHRTLRLDPLASWVYRGRAIGLGCLVVAGSCVIDRQRHHKKCVVAGACKGSPGHGWSDVFPLARVWLPEAPEILALAGSSRPQQWLFRPLGTSGQQVRRMGGCRKRGI